MFPELFPQVTWTTVHVAVTAFVTTALFTGSTHAPPGWELTVAAVAFILLAFNLAALAVFLWCGVRSVDEAWQEEEEVV